MGQCQMVCSREEGERSYAESCCATEVDRTFETVDMSSDGGSDSESEPGTAVDDSPATSPPVAKAKDATKHVWSQSYSHPILPPAVNAPMPSMSHRAATCPASLWQQWAVPTETPLDVGNVRRPTNPTLLTAVRGHGVHTMSGSTRGVTLADGEPPRAKPPQARPEVCAAPRGAATPEPPPPSPPQASPTPPQPEVPATTMCASTAKLPSLRLPQLAPQQAPRAPRDEDTQDATASARYTPQLRADGTDEHGLTYTTLPMVMWWEF